MDLAEAVAQLELIKAQAARAVVPAATAMATGVRREISQVTLRQTSHPRFEFYHAPVGAPPARATGNLARSIRSTAAYGEVRAFSSVAAYAEYAALQEYGGATWPSRSRYMHWFNTGGEWLKRIVHVPEHPYMRPTVQRMSASGQISRDARNAFWARMEPFF